MLSIAGDIDINEAKQLVKKYFATIPVKKPEIYRPSDKMTPINGVVRDTIYDNIQLPAAMQIYKIPALGTPDFYAVQMLSTLLAGGQSSRLYKSIVDEQQLALQTGNFAFELEHPGIGVAFGICNQGVGAEKVHDAIDAEIKRVQTELIGEKEFQKLINQTESSFVQANSRISGIAESLANYHIFYGDANLINTELDRYLKVTREDIQRVANKYFKLDQRALLTYLPKTDTP